MIQFVKYRRIPGGFAPSDKQEAEEPTEFTTTPVEVGGLYWVSGPLNTYRFQIQQHDTGSTEFSLRSVVFIPKPPTQIKILTELQKLVKHPILCDRGNHDELALNIRWGDVPKNLREYLICEDDTVYLPL